MQHSSVIPSRKTKGVKRKRDNFEQNEFDTEIERKLKHKIQEIRKTIKKVKLFEIQRVVKKMKGSVNSGVQVHIEQLHKELDYLKHVDTEFIAITALKTKAKKDRFLVKNDHFQSAFSNLATRIPDRISSRSFYPTVDSRILSSKLLSKEIEKVITALKTFLGDDNAKVTAYGEIKYVGNGPEIVESGNGVASNFNSVSESEKSDVEENSEWLSDSVPGSSANSNFEHGEIENSGKDTNAQPSFKYTKQQTEKELIAPLNSSTLESRFLPSLPVGFIPAKSGSDWSDAESSIAGDIRKNRRGQRARKAIWEKKYGRNANHVRRQREMQGGIRSGTGRINRDSFSTKDLNPKLNVANNHSNIHRDNTQPVAITTHRNYKEKGSQSSATFTKAKAMTEKPLHPSWEAKRKLKEKHSAAIVPSQGTKLTFD